MSTPAPAPVGPPRLVRWHRRVSGICVVIFAFELGLFLLIFPWLSTWDLSWVPVHSARFASVWMSPYFRGALGGLGLLNLYVALVEAARQVKSFFAPKQ